MFCLGINNNEFQVRFLITGGLFQKDQNMIKYKHLIFAQIPFSGVSIENDAFDNSNEKLRSSRGIQTLLLLNSFDSWKLKLYISFNFSAISRISIEMKHC